MMLASILASSMTGQEIQEKGMQMEEQQKIIDRRVKRSQHLLQQALMELMTIKKFSSITIQDITERAEVNRGTFYTHFPDKYALLDAIMYNQFQSRLVSKLPQNPRWERKVLRILIQTILEIFKEAYNRCPPTEMTDPLIKQTAQQQLGMLLLRWLKEVPSPKTGWSVPIETIALMTSWAIMGAVVEWSQKEKRLSTEQMAEHILTVISTGMVPLT